MITSILGSVKKNLGLDPSYTEFDPDILMHINATFANLHTLGIGPSIGFMIEDSAPTWDDFLGSDPRLNNVKTYVFFCVKMGFDPPQVGYLVTALEKQKEELEYRMLVFRESTQWVNPFGITEPEPYVIDGGTP